MKYLKNKSQIDTLFNEIAFHYIQGKKFKICKRRKKDFYSKEYVS